jgi:hypothetical protein
MASDSEPESGTAPAPKAASSSTPPSADDRPKPAKKKKLKRPRPPIPKTEAEIDSPSKQTVGMLGVLGILTVVMWAFARGGCNYHPPKETRTPRQVTTEELARDPKNAAVELQQRWLTRDFTGALELANSNVAAEIKKDQAACDAGCLGERKSLADKVLTSAVILDANMLGATARVTSWGLPGGPKVFLMRLERADSIWKASERKLDDGVPPTLPTTAVSPHDVSVAPGASPSASAPTPGAAAPHGTQILPKRPVTPTPAPASSK